jgi:hypothetical protein
MIRILSIDQALQLRGTIPDLAILRSQQFQGEGYIPEDHGSIIVIEAGDDLRQVPELAPDGLYDSEGYPLYEYIEAFIENGRVVYEIVFAIDNEKTIAVIAAEDCLDAQLRIELQQATQGSTPAAL